MHFSPDALIISIPAIVKAVTAADGKRMLEVEASNTEVDSEGDVIEQTALLNSAKSFIESGCIDLDHISEIGHRMGVPNPESFILGKPIEVKDLGKGRTGVVAEIFRSPDGVVDIVKNRYDSVWEAIRTGVRYKASIYGFPEEDGVEDCRGRVCESGARRFHIKSMQWKSLALTRNPINDAITGFAKIITAKSYMDFIMKNGADGVIPWQVYMSELQLPKPPIRIPANASTPNTNAQNRPAGMGTVPPTGQISAPTIAQAQSGAPGLPASTGEHVPVYPNEDFMTQNGNIANAEPGAVPMPSSVVSCAMPRDLSDAVGQWHTHIKDNCVHSGGLKSTVGFRKHFEVCCGMPREMAELFSHALVHQLLLNSRRVR